MSSSQLCKNAACGLVSAEVDPSHFSYHGDIPLQELIDSRQTGEGRLHRIETLAPAVKKNTSVQGGKDMDAEMQALQSDWKQWEENAFQSQNKLQELESHMAWSEQEFAAQAVLLEEALQRFSTLLATWSEGLTPLDSKHTDQELVECWHREKVNCFLSVRLSYTLMGGGGERSC